MRKLVLILGITAVFSFTSFAQSKNDTIQQLQRQILNLENLNSILSTRVSTANSNMKKLERIISANEDSLALLAKELIQTNKNLQELANNFGLQIKQLSTKTDENFLTVSNTVRKNTIYWILAVFLIGLLSAFLFGRLRNKLISEKTGLSDQIKNSSEPLREKLLKLDNQVFWLLESHLQSAKSEQLKPDEINHSLALKVADEIIRIQKILNSMDQDAKELKQIAFAVDRIQDYFKENGYEMVEMLNMSYDKGMKVSAKFKHDESLKHGEQIITKIIKPQINYKGVIIQEAQVEVSTGEPH